MTIGVTAFLQGSLPPGLRMWCRRRWHTVVVVVVVVVKRLLFNQKFDLLDMKTLQPEVFKEKGLSAHGAEIVLLLPSEIDFWYAAHATEPARAPPSVASRGCPLSLRCAQIAQDGRAGPRLWTPQRRLPISAIICLLEIRRKLGISTNDKGSVCFFNFAQRSGP